ncbi:major facilitator superfamily transporter [Dactylonectria macrodidyma]|uniref:Major facilitator superfamily transporter n=1 Tax=Dactylonectria macrodidyma TaxID=307937 RepID=A0A9P9ET67_9HYPO|nr:major facilitator superfamily transporter [Dactylonectria macrodidyma]
MVVPGKMVDETRPAGVEEEPSNSPTPLQTDRCLSSLQEKSQSSNKNAGKPSHVNSASQVLESHHQPPEHHEDSFGLHTDCGTTSSEDQIYVVKFEGDHDPMCPRSMSKIRKWIIINIVCMATLCVTCASSIYTTTYTHMIAEFSTTPFITTIGLSIFVLGIALGPLLTSPLSEWYGRRPVYLVSWSFFIIWTITAAVSKNIQTMIVGRFLAGFTGGTFLSVSGGSVWDVFPRHEIQIPMILVSTAPFLGPCLGPLIGGFITSHIDWRWNHYFIIIWSVTLLLSIIFFAPETYHPIKLEEKAEILRKQTGDCRYKALIKRSCTSRCRALAFSLLRPLQLIILEPMCLALDIYSAVLLGLLYLFFRTFNLLFTTTYGMELWQVGLSFLGIISGMILAASSIPLWQRIKDRLLAGRGKETDESEPEYRLIPAIPGGVLIPVGLFWFGWSMDSNIHWIVPIIGSAIFGCGTVLVFTGIFTFLVDAYPQYAASALAGNGFVRASFGAAFPLFAIQMYDALGYHWATSLLAFITVILMPLPWVFFKYGEAIRGRSKFALRP